MKESLRIAIYFVALVGICSAQRGDIIIPATASVTIPLNAQICADRIFANNPGYGTLSLANPNCLCAGAVVLPVELQSFSAVVFTGAVHLQWITASETNCAGFEVQRSRDAISWMPVGFIQGHGNSSTKNSYGYRDPVEKLPFIHALSYRLKIVDTDGSVSYSPIVEVQLENEAVAPVLSIPYPNPAKGCFTIHISLPEATAISVALYNANGILVQLLKDRVATARGAHTFQVPVANLPAGTYMLELIAGDIRRVQQIIITR